MTAALIDGLAQFFAPTQLLAVVALGLLAGQDVKQFPVATLATYAFGLAVASIMVAAAQRAQDTVPIWLLAVAALAGIAVAVARPIPQVAKTIAASLTGGLIAFNAPPQTITIPSAVAAQVGTAIAALATLAVVMVIAMKGELPWSRIALRVVGSWIAASAILVLALRLAR
jgi:urease accessory protein